MSEKLKLARQINQHQRIQLKQIQQCFRPFYFFKIYVYWKERYILVQENRHLNNAMHTFIIRLHELFKIKAAHYFWILSFCEAHLWTVSMLQYAYNYVCSRMILLFLLLLNWSLAWIVIFFWSQRKFARFQKKLTLCSSRNVLHVIWPIYFIIPSMQ